MFIYVLQSSLFTACVTLYANNNVYTRIETQGVRYMEHLLLRIIHTAAGTRKVKDVYGSKL